MLLVNPWNRQLLLHGDQPRPVQFTATDITLGPLFISIWIDDSTSISRRGAGSKHRVFPAYIEEHLGGSLVLRMNTASPYVYQPEGVQRFPHPGTKVNRSSYTIIRW